MESAKRYRIMAEEQLGQILELVKGIAGKQEASDARLAATEARLDTVDISPQK